MGKRLEWYDHFRCCRYIQFSLIEHFGADTPAALMVRNE